MNIIPRINIVTRWGAVTLAIALLAQKPCIAQTNSSADVGSQSVIAELLNRVADLESEVTSLRAEKSDEWLTNERANEIRDLISNVLADADSRVSLENQSPTAGYDDHFFLASADGNFRMEFSGQVQLRFVYNHLESFENSDRVGFENRRTKLKFSGHVINPRLRYSVTGAFDDETGGFSLNGAYASYALTDEITVRAGRQRPPLQREEDVSSKRQLLAERSLVSRAFKQNRTIGAGIQYDQETFRIKAAFMDATKNRFDDQSFIAAARAEFLLAGEWSQLRDFTSFRSDEPVIAFGFGALIQDQDFEDPDDDDAKLLRWTADVSMEFGGANLFAAIIGNHLDEDDQDTLDQYGIVLQGGFFVTDNTELFAQYIWGDAGNEEADLSILTLGFNHYLAEHNLKWTVDVGYAFNEVGDFWASESSGYRENDAGDTGQIVLRAQWQLLF